MSQLGIKPGTFRFPGRCPDSLLTASLPVDDGTLLTLVGSTSVLVNIIPFLKDGFPQKNHSCLVNTLGDCQGDNTLAKVIV